MWLNVIILSLASLSVGIILGWIIARPRRWEYVGEEPLPRPDKLADMPGLTSGGVVRLRPAGRS
jgi:hypothetical protein